MSRDPERPDGVRPDLVALADSDEVLTRLSRRQPDAEDLDDPLLAALAVLATDVDLDPVPLQRTRRALQHQGLWPPRPSAASEEDPPLEDLGPDPAVTIARPRMRRSRGGPVDDAITEPLAKHALQAPTEASGVSRFVTTVAAPGSGLGMRLAPALAAAGAAVVLSMGAAAALTKGESVNPATAIVRVVEQITEESSAPGAPGTGPGSTTAPGGFGPATGEPGDATSSSAGSDGAVTSGAGTDPAADSSDDVAGAVGEGVVDVVPTVAPTDGATEAAVSASSSQAATSSTTQAGEDPPGKGPKPTKPGKAKGKLPAEG